MNEKKSISIIKEKRNGEDRVVAVPNEIALFVNNGYDVWVEQDSGIGAGISNDEYIKAGAKITDTNTAWRCSRWIVKLKAPVKEEFQYFHENLHLCAFFHLEDSPELADALCRHGVTAYAYEFLTMNGDIFPISIPQSEISGKLAIIYGAYHMQHHLGGQGILLADTVGVPKPKVVIIGYGNAGGSAVKMALALGLEVVVIGTNQEKLRRFRTMLPSEVKCLLNIPEVVEREVTNADLVIGAVLISTYDTPPIIDEKLVKKMKKGSMIIDVTCGYGCGYLPTFNQFSFHDTPTYKRHGVIHCKIDSFPNSVPVTASKALSHQIAPYLLGIGDSIYNKKNITPMIESCMIVAEGRIVSDIVINNHDLIAELKDQTLENALSR